ncbi:flavodoxin family protein [Streptomyces subrutilus]|uniref:Flavodoxin n=1 Tax=Streptomyces subrutilus TaxID=36818 RepID=A0A5P2V0A8_9ACTN|nr:NAD(P)H-dependent oxidoreductase [Streptomyces subrutilus]QEU82477.1 flavodoxin family protein [Streptomyces subrutilus]WSJ28052.1 NAD(P)H-dependent oxidoreductase [Streptomyces subrutilus]GGZ81474.1 flavodoxin [Streptomyces subrutilus]
MDTNETTPLRAVALVCTLSPSPKPSSSQLLAEQAMAALAEHGVTGKVIRVADHDVKPGVEADMGDGDAWPEIRQVILGADILILSTPIWLGHASSIAQRVLERLDAEISETDDEGRLLTYGKVAGVCVVGNEDGAHKVSADLFQGLNDVGFSLAPGAVTYWVGEAMQGTDYQDLDKTPDATRSTTATLAANTAHLARLLKRAAFPAS